LSTVLSRESLSLDLPHPPRGHVEASPETRLKVCKLLGSDPFAAEIGPHIAGAAVNGEIFKPIGPSRDNVPRIEVRVGLGAFEIQSEVTLPITRLQFRPLRRKSEIRRVCHRQPVGQL